MTCWSAPRSTSGWNVSGPRSRIFRAFSPSTPTIPRPTRRARPWCASPVRSRGSTRAPPPMPPGTQPDFFAASTAAVADTDLRRKLENATGRHLDHVAATRAEFPAYEAERDASRRIKEDSIARLDELLVQLKERLEANGCSVFVAADAAEARKYVVDLARARGARRVVKGKSMATEEIALNAALADAG